MESLAREKTSMKEERSKLQHQVMHQVPDVAGPCGQTPDDS